MIKIKAGPISAQAFAPFGDLLEADGNFDASINQGKCKRYHDRAALSFDGGRAGVSLFEAEPRSLPYQLTMMERHPLGSQCFAPMHQHPFLVTVAQDDAGKPATPRAFLTKPGQAINIHLGVWHGVLTPLNAPGLFTVIDRIGDGNNLEEFYFDAPYLIV
ncbi:MAG: ureidoglycolate lyase [Pseudomonadota bacterium]